MRDRLSRRGLFSAGLASLFAGFATNLFAQNSEDKENMRQTQLYREGNTPEKNTATESGTSIKAEKEEPPDTGIRPLIQELLTKTDKLIPTGPSLQRSQDELQIWEKIKQKLATDYAISENGELSGKLTRRFHSIESDFNFTNKSDDHSFNLLHIEPLIDQAADLFDRGVRDRASWDEIGSKWMSLMLELHEFAQLDEIHRREEVAGVYEIPMKQSWADFLSDKLAALKTSSGVLKLERLLNVYLSPTGKQVVSAEAQKASWLSGLVAYSFGSERFNGYVSHTWDGKEDTVARHAAQAAFIQVGVTLDKETSYAQVQRDSLEASNAAAVTRMDGNRAKYDWDTANSGFLRERTLVARRLQDLKMKMATEPDGLLNYAKRLDSLRNRFHGDFRDALARLQAIQKGMAIVYGYDVPLPTQNESPDYFDQCHIWTRDAIQWLIRFARQEQSFVYPISIRWVLGDDMWEKGTKTGNWKVVVPRDLFAGMAHVRVRGVSLFSESCFLCDNDRLWQVQLKPPAASQILHESGAWVELDQSHVPPARSFRVCNRQSQREPDVVAVSAWHNVSPIGEWQVKVLGSTPPTNVASALKDLVVDLLVSYRSL